MVIPTASIPQGVSAMMAVDPDMSDADAIAKAMTDAAQCVSTAQITYAARNSDFDGFDIHEGDYLALLDGKLLGTDRDVSALLDGLSDEAASREAEFITVFYGEDVNEEDARKACDAFTRKCPDAEVNLICGGQPVYSSRSNDPSTAKRSRISPAPLFSARQTFIFRPRSFIKSSAWRYSSSLIAANSLLRHRSSVSSPARA